MNLNYTIPCYSLKHLGVSCMNNVEYDTYQYALILPSEAISLPWYQYSLFL